jgi:hypothetical protein
MNQKDAYILKALSQVTDALERINAVPTVERYKMIDTIVDKMDIVKGEPGEKGEKGEPFKYSDLTANQKKNFIEAVLKEVPKPKDGETPVKGEDYYTLKEKDELFQELKSHLDTLEPKVVNKTIERGITNKQKEEVYNYIFKQLEDAFPTADTLARALEELPESEKLDPIKGLKNFKAAVRKVQKKGGSAIVSQGSGSSTFTGLTDTPSSYSGEGGKVLKVKATEDGVEFGTVSGTGDVVGPASATNNAVARFDTTTGKLIQNSPVVIADTGTINLNGTGDIRNGIDGDVTLQVNDGIGTDDVLKVVGATKKVQLTQEGSAGFVKTDASGNLTGGETISASDVTDFDTEVSNNPSVTANTAKVTNATHSGDASGDTTLTLNSTAISGKGTNAGLAGTEEVLINNGGTLEKTTTQDIADLGGGGGSTTLQDAYDNSTDGKIDEDGTRGSIDLVPASANSNVLTVRDSTDVRNVITMFENSTNGGLLSIARGAGDTAHNLVGAGSSYVSRFGNFGVGTNAPQVQLDVKNGETQLAPPTTTYPTLNLPSGSDPTTPGSGDMWFNGTNLNFNDGSTTTDLLAGGGGGARTFTKIVAASDSLDATGADYTCDGTDDEVEIQSAIDAVNTAGGGTVLLLDGNYDIDTTSIVLKSNVVLKGMGIEATVLKKNGSVSILVADSSNTNYAGVRNLKFDGLNSTTTTHYAIEDTGSGAFYDCTFDTLKFEDFKANTAGICMYLQKSFRNSVLNTITEDCTSFGFFDDETLVQNFRHNTNTSSPPTSTSNANVIVLFGPNSRIDNVYINADNNTRSTGLIQVSGRECMVGNVFIDGTNDTPLAIDMSGQHGQCYNIHLDSCSKSGFVGVRLDESYNSLHNLSFNGLNSTNSVAFEIDTGAQNCLVNGVSGQTCAYVGRIDASAAYYNICNVNVFDCFVGLFDKVKMSSSLFGNIRNVGGGNNDPMFYEEEHCMQYENVSGAQIDAGMIVVMSWDNNGNNVTTTTTAGSIDAIGIAAENISNGDERNIIKGGDVSIMKVDGTDDIAIGDYLGTSTTAGIAKKATSGEYAIAVALEAYTNDDTNGVIDARILNKPVYIA